MVIKARVDKKRRKLLYESEVEARLVEADCTIAGLTADNKSYIEGFQKAGEHVVIIEDDYEETIEGF